MTETPLLAGFLLVRPMCKRGAVGPASTGVKRNRDPQQRAGTCRRPRLNGRYRCEIVIRQRGRERFNRVENASSVFSGADAQIGGADYLDITWPATGLADKRTQMVVAVNVSSGTPEDRTFSMRLLRW